MSGVRRWPVRMFEVARPVVQPVGRATVVRHPPGSPRPLPSADVAARDVDAAIASVRTLVASHGRELRSISICQDGAVSCVVYAKE